MRSGRGSPDGRLNVAAIMSEDTIPSLAQRLDTLAERIDQLKDRFDRLDDRLARAERRSDIHEHTLYGPQGRNGLRHDVRELKAQSRVAGTVTTKTLIGVVTAVVTAFGALIGFVVGIL